MKTKVLIAISALFSLTSMAQELTQTQIDSLMALGFEAFDQDMEGGWRYYGNQMEFATAADLIQRYLKQHPEIEEHQQAVMHWHAGQMLALDGQNDMAVLEMEASRKENDVMLWNEYLDATVAFLEKDRQTFETNLKALEAMGNNPNLKLLKILEANFDKTYREALELAMKQ